MLNEPGAPMPPQENRANQPAKALDTLMAFCVSVGVASSSPQNMWGTWEQICQCLMSLARQVSAQKDQMLIAFAHFAPDFKIGSLIGDIHAIALDFDHVYSRAELMKALTLAKEISTHGICHTTWSDDPDAPNGTCFRIIIPFDKPLPLSEYSTVWERFAAAFTAIGVPPDGQCKNPNRRYYVPVTRHVIDTQGPGGLVLQPTVTVCTPQIEVW